MRLYNCTSMLMIIALLCMMNNQTTQIVGIYDILDGMNSNLTDLARNVSEFESSVTDFSSIVTDFSKNFTKSLSKITEILKNMSN